MKLSPRGLPLPHLLNSARLLGIHRDDPFRPHPNRDVVKHCLGQLFLHRLDITFIQVGSQQADTAVDVKSNTTYETQNSQSNTSNSRWAGSCHPKLLTMIIGLERYPLDYIQLCFDTVIQAASAE